MRWDVLLKVSFGDDDMGQRAGCCSGLTDFGAWGASNEDAVAFTVSLCAPEFEGLLNPVCIIRVNVQRLGVHLLIAVDSTEDQPSRQGARAAE